MGGNDAIPWYTAPRMPFHMDRGQVIGSWKAAVTKNISEPYYEQDGYNEEKAREKRQEHDVAVSDDEKCTVAKKTVGR